MAPPGFEPGLQESESCVLNQARLWNQREENEPPDQMAFSPWVMSGIFLLALTAILSVVYFFKRPRAIAVRPREARELIRTRATTVVDVRTDDEWAASHYSHAFHIPLSHLQTTLPKHIADRATTLLIYCRTGRRAAQAAETANRLGYTTVYYLIDGSYEDLEEHLRYQ